jgi:nucleotide-binding universal stress UspA family protein
METNGTQAAQAPAAEIRGAVVVGIDGSAAGQEALRWALREARLRSVPLRVVYAWTFGYAGLPVGGVGSMASAGALSPSGLALSDMRQAAEDLLDRTSAELIGDFEDVVIEHQAVEGTAAAALIGAAGEDDLLVVGSRGHGGFAGLMLGSVSQHCAHHARCPVVIVHPAAKAPVNRRGLPRSMPTGRRVLVLSNEELADANEVPEAIRPLVEAAEQIFVVVPALTTRMQWLTDDRDSALVAADERLRTVFDHMHADGLDPQGQVGAENQLTAISDALTAFDADLIVLRLHLPGGHRDNRKEHKIAAKVRERFGVPTVAFYFDGDGHVVGHEEAGTA